MMKAAFSHASRLCMALVLTTGMLGCSFHDGAIAFLDTAWALRGDWIIDHTTASGSISAYYRLAVGVDNSYEIVGYNSQVIERGTMRNVTSDGFDYAITFQKLYPLRVGNNRPALWSVTDGELGITFYQDATLLGIYASFAARHP